MASLLSGLGRLFGRFTVNAAEQAIGYGTGSAMGAALAPEVQALLNEIWPTDPNMPLSPADAANAVVQGALERAAAAAQAERSGVGGDVFETLVRITGEPPGPQELVSMRLRGIIDDPRLRLGLRQSRLKPEWVEETIAAGAALDTIADLAEMVVQSVLDEGEAARLAAELGYSGEQFARLVRLAGSPPGPELALSLWNRGLIDEGQATLALRQSRLKPEWVEQVKRSRLRPASAQEAAAAVVRERITLDEGLRIAQANGVDADSFRLMVETGGRPIALGEALTLFNRGQFTREQVREAVARSNVRTEYTDDILKLAVRYPPLFQVQRLVQGGSIDDAYAIELIVKQGYPQRLAEGIVHAAHGAKQGGHKELSAAIIAALFEAGLENHEEAARAIAHLGYSEQEAAEYLRLHLARRIVAELTHGMTMIRSRYTGWKIDRPTAIHELNTVTGDPSVAERNLPLWDAEREANAPGLSHAQIGQGFHYGRFTADEAIERWQRQGYSADDALTLAWIVAKGDPLAGPPPAGPPSIPA